MELDFMTTFRMLLYTQNKLLNIYQLFLLLYFSFSSLKSILITLFLQFGSTQQKTKEGMDNLTQQQYETVLKYMEKFGQDNFQKAYEVMKDNDFNISNMRQNRNNRDQAMNLNNNHQQREAQGQMIPQGNINNGRIINQEIQQQQQQQQEEMAKITQYLLERGSRKRKTRIQKSLACMKLTCTRLIEIFVPEVIKKKVIRSSFYQLYQDECVIQLKNKNIQQAYSKSKRNSRNIMIVTSERGKNHCVIEFLKKKKVLLKIEEEYELVGVIDSQLPKQYKQMSLKSYMSKTLFDNTEGASVIIVRQNHTEGLEIVDTLKKQSEILGINEEYLFRIKQKIKLLNNKQSTLLRRISQKLYESNYQLQNFGDHNQQNRQYIEDAQQDHQQPEENYIRNKREGKLIAQQNKQYLQMEKKKQEMEKQEREKKEQFQRYLIQREARKQSIPQQPEGNIENVIKIIFRCPNGDNMTRRFLNSQKCELLYNWVQINDDIQFEGQQQDQMDKNVTPGQNKKVIKMRRFDLLHSYPPESLKQKQDLSLVQIFQGQDQVKILIREQ